VYARIRSASFPEAYRMLEIITFCLPFPWVFGRLGCFLMHDHRANSTTNWIAGSFRRAALRFGPHRVHLFSSFQRTVFSGWIETASARILHWPLRFGLLRIPYLARRLAVEPFRFYGWIAFCLIGVIALWVGKN